MKQNRVILYICIIVIITLALSSIFSLNKIYSYSIEDKQLKNQLNIKDAQISSINKDLTKTNSELQDYKNKYDNHIQFTKDYAILLNNIHVALEQLDLANDNLQYGNVYINDNQYVYSTAISYYHKAKDQALTAKDLLTKARLKFNTSQAISTDAFLSKDIINRLKQIDLLLKAVDDLYTLADYKSSELYQVNYGDKDKAHTYFLKYNDFIDTVNSDLRRLSEINNEIDLEWNANWYPLFHETK